MDNRGPPPPGSRDGQGSQQGDRRFASLLAAKGGAEAAVRQAAGVPGPWEPVASLREVRACCVEAFGAASGGGVEVLLYIGEGQCANYT